MKCAACIDQVITEGGDSPDAAREAVTTVAIAQILSVGGQPVGGIVPLPVCFECRVLMVKPLSKRGLVTALWPAPSAATCSSTTTTTAAHAAAAS